MNVYYLPARQIETPDPLLTVTPWSIFKARAHRAVWRLRLTVTEIWAVVRRGSRVNPLEQHIWFADEAPLAPRRRALGPARIIDLDAARRRRAVVAVPATV